MLAFCSIISILAVVVLSLELSHVAGSQVTRIRGVPLNKNSLYPPDKFFTCLDGSKKIPFKYVNDDYCDCPDNSDEPGTSACPTGSFYCENSGYEDKYIPSSRVNDGICDCCDASDEYDDKIKCSNVCSILGQAARAEAEKKQVLYKEGSQIRADMILRGKQLESENKDKLVKMRDDHKEAESIKIEKEKIKAEWEERENSVLEKYKKAEPEEQVTEPPTDESREIDAEEYFRMLDNDESGTIDMIEITSRLMFDRDGNGIVSEEEAMYFLGNQDQPNLEEFIHKAWDNIKPFAMKERGLFVPPSEEGEQQDVETATGDDADLPEDEDEDDAHDEPEKEPEPEIKYTEEEQAIIDEAERSRTEYKKAEKDVMDLESEIRTIEQKMERDYGIDQVFASMDGECFQYTDLEYIYSLCMYGRATQSSKAGGSEVNLGHWNDWTGPASDRYSRMKFANGLTCWNGPARSVDVELRCGKENKLIGVAEPSRCEYSMIFVTPAVCHTAAIDAEAHDEL